MENIFYENPEGETIELENVPINIDEKRGEKYFTFADILNAEQNRIAKKWDLSTNNVIELLTLFAPVKSRFKGIKQKFRFNKIIFYIGKEIENEIGKNILDFDSMYAAGAGPIPEHLTEDIQNLREKDLVTTHIEFDGKKIPQSSDDYDKLMKSKSGSGVVLLTPSGETLAQKLWIEMMNGFGDEFLDSIQKTKERLIYMDTEQLKDKVHSEYPEWQKKYTQNDRESIFI